MKRRITTIHHELFIEFRIAIIANENSIEHGREHEESSAHLTRQQIERLESERGQIGRLAQSFVGEAGRARVGVGEEQVGDGENGRRVD